MTNFNPINTYFNKLLNPQNIFSRESIPNQNENNNIQKNIINNSSMTQNSKQNIQIQQNIPKVQIMNFENVKMENEIVQKYIQSLMDLPESIEKFIENFEKNSKLQNLNDKTFKFLQVFVENMLNTKALNQLLNENSKNAIQKLLNAMTTVLKNGSGDISQLKEILSVLNSIQASTNLNSNSIKELLLLYIPINYQVFNKDFDFSALEAENEDKIKSSTMSILFETINFSNVFISLNEQEDEITMEVFVCELFPKDRFKNIMINLAKESSIKTYIEFKKSKPSQKHVEKQSFKIISNDYISANILLLSHIIIGAILKMDLKN